MPSSEGCCLRSAWRQLEGSYGTPSGAAHESWRGSWWGSQSWHHSWGSAPSSREGVETLWARPMAHWHPQTEEDVGCLISTLAVGLQMGTPRINVFSGDAMPGKTEVSFKQWNHEVQCIKDHYPISVVWKSIVRSLKGAVVDMASYMGPTTSVAHILKKLAICWYCGII